MRRGFWFMAGTGAGVYLTIRARRAAEAFTPEGLQDRLAGLGVGARLFGEEVRAGMTEKETELRERIGPRLDGVPELRSSGFEAHSVRAPTSGSGASTSGDLADKEQT
ncbi:MAG: DUF6167 family protein [Marmoricola sp.]